MREARQNTFSGTIINSGSTGSGSAHHHKEQAGEVRLAVRYEEHVVLPLIEYEPLVKVRSRDSANETMRLGLLEIASACTFSQRFFDTALPVSSQLRQLSCLVRARQGRP